MNDKSEFTDEVRFRCSPLAVLPFILLFFILTALAIYLTYLYPGSVQYIDLYPLIEKDIYLPIPLFFIIPLFLLSYIMHTLYDALYIIGEDYVRATYGLLSFNKTDVRLEFVDVRGIEINRGIYGRIVNTGTIHVGTAMREEEELFIINVYNPSQYRDLILKRRNYIEKGLANNHTD